jgi:hypothetical protein
VEKKPADPRRTQEPTARVDGRNIGFYPVALIFILIAVVAAVALAASSERLAGWLVAHRVLGCALLVAVSIPLLVAFFRFPAPSCFPFDDSYISLAAARNLADHGELAVILGRPLVGVTSPLHVLLVGGLGTLVGVELAARAISVLAFFAAAIAVGCTARKLADDDRALPLGAGLFVVAGPMLFDVGNGMETSLFTALLIASFYLSRFPPAGRRGIVWRGLAIGLLTLARPEGLIAGAILLGAPLFAAFRERSAAARREALLVAALAGGVLAPVLVANLALNGDAMSSTVSAKSVFFMRGGIAVPELAQLGKPLDIFLLGAKWVGVAAVIGLSLSRSFRELSFAAAFYLSFMLRFPDALNHYHARYQHPLWAFVAVGAAVLVFRLARRIGGSRIGRRIALFGAASLVLGSSMWGTRGYAQSFLTDARMGAEQLLPMIAAVRARSAPNALVATHDVGGLAYYGGRPLLDIVGLTDAEVANRLAAKKKNVYREVRRIVAEERPALLVVLREWDDRFLHLTRGAHNGVFRLAWSSIPHAATGVVYDVYACAWEAAGDGEGVDPTTPKPPEK